MYIRVFAALNIVGVHLNVVNNFVNIALRRSLLNLCVLHDQAEVPAAKRRNPQDAD